MENEGIRLKLNAELAQKIVKEARSSLNEHFIIVDTNFKIIASSEQSRVGEYHEGAKKAIEEDRTIDITPDDVARLKGVKPGINMPIKHEGEIIGVIGITGNPSEVRPYADLIRRLTELFIREAIQTEQLESQSRAVESFVYEWVHRDSLDQDFIEQSEILGIAISQPMLVIMGRVDQPYQQIKSLLQKLLLHKNDRIVQWSDQRFLLLFHQQTYDKYKIAERLRRFIKNTDTVVKFGAAKMPRENIIRPSYDEAQKALNAATNDEPIIFYESLGLDILLQDITPETRSAFIQNTWLPIIENEELLETLCTYLNEDLSVSKAAHLLHIHVNTLHYRLKRLEELTGINLHTTKGIVTAYLAMSLLENK